jgi:hypothetical protein
MPANGLSTDVIELRGEPLRFPGPEALVLGVRQSRDRLGLVPDAVDGPLGHRDEGILIFGRGSGLIVFSHRSFASKRA